MAPLYGQVVTLERTVGAYCQHGVNHTATKIGERASWRVFHDEQRYEALRLHARRLGLPEPGQLGDNDPIYLEERAAASLLSEGGALPGGQRRRLAHSAVKAMSGLPTSPKRRAMLSAWWLLVGYAPTPMARAVLSWKLQAASRPAIVQKLAKMARNLGGVARAPAQA